ncbi:hypothetical protein BTVI_14677 [Pitangus sulphuratus]|nr:hypothetical protein BTVI_14677 [Pitangus sulphuratus]
MEIQEYSLASQRFSSVLPDLEDLTAVRTMPVEKQTDLRGHFLKQEHLWNSITSSDRVGTEEEERREPERSMTNATVVQTDLNLTKDFSYAMDWLNSDPIEIRLQGGAEGYS